MTQNTPPLNVLVLATVAVASAAAQGLKYPDSRRGDQTDTYFETRVADPYRWLEDETSAETKRWVEQQNKVTSSYFRGIPYGGQVKARLTALYDYPRYGAPFRRGEYYFFSKNEGLQNQSVYYRQKGLDGTPEVLLDPNTFSADQTTTLAEFALSRSGDHLAYCQAQGGSDWRTCYVMEVASRRRLPDELRWVKVSALAWAGEGFFYSRYDAPREGRELSAQNENHRVFFHRIGTAQTADELVFEDPANPQRFHIAITSEDERFVILSVSERGKGKAGTRCSSGT